MNANPALNLSLEVAQSTDDKRRTANPRQRIEIDDPVWRAGHPDLTADELAAYMAMVDTYGQRVASGEVPDWEAYERDQYGYPTYEHQSYGFEEAIGFIRESARHIASLCADRGIALSAPAGQLEAA